MGRIAQRLKTANLPFAAFHVVIEENDGEECRRQLRAICRLARVLTVPILTIPAAPFGSDLDQEIRRLSVWCQIAAADGVILSIETHGETLTADPLCAAELCRRIPA